MIRTRTRLFAAPTAYGCVFSLSIKPPPVMTRSGTVQDSRVKRKCGIEVGENYNPPKTEDSRQPQCPAEKEKAIKYALEHFGMV